MESIEEFSPAEISPFQINATPVDGVISLKIS
jgi:hypothetical protein